MSTKAGQAQIRGATLEVLADLKRDDNRVVGSVPLGR
jgi:hypothetical protein